MTIDKRKDAKQVMLGCSIFQEGRSLGSRNERRNVGKPLMRWRNGIRKSLELSKIGLNKNVKAKFIFDDKIVSCWFVEILIMK